MSQELVERARAWLAGSPGQLTPHRVAEALRASGAPVGDATVLAVHEALRRDVLGAGPLEPLLRRPGCTDVIVNGPAEVYVDCGDGLRRTEVTFPDDAAVRRLAQRLAAAGHRRLDDETPHVDVRLPDGTRCHAVLAPVARPGTLISLRVPALRHRRLDDLVGSGFLSGEAAGLVRALIRSRWAFLVSGGTGSGKTTFLSSLLGEVPPDERVVIVEDSTELRPDHPHTVGLEARLPNAEGHGQIALRTLVRQALRMRPDRLVVGEVRGAEVVELLAALNTGHEGGCGTLHANSAVDVPARLEALALAAGLPRDACHAQISAALDAVLHVVRRGAQRRLQQIGVPVRGDDGLVRIDVAVEFTADGSARPGPAAALLDWPC